MQLSVVIPVYNEAPCLDALGDELHAALSGRYGAWEVILVDDASTDDSPNRLRALCARLPGFRSLRLASHQGQSAALAAGFEAARAPVIAMLDADGQNDPADIPRLVDALDRCDLCCGIRAERRDTAARRWAGRLANAVRNRILGESVTDTGCTLKAVKADFVRGLFVWDGMHRFLPALVRLRGGVVTEQPVTHRPRRAGRGKYTNLGRLRRVAADLLAVRWMQQRARSIETDPA
ncbi:MAG: glycosyltransferase [Lentisphaerae bacterium]|nr:glycosyltransferase [Lentisphaerota bacterium]